MLTCPVPSVPVVPPSPTCRMPPEISVDPVYVLLLATISVPLPIFVRLPPTMLPEPANL